MSVTIFHLPDSVLLNAKRQSCNLSDNNSTTYGFQSGVPIDGDPLSSSWIIEYSADILPRDFSSNTYKPNSYAGWANFEAVITESYHRKFLVTAFDTANREPRGTPLVDITQGDDCGDNSYPFLDNQSLVQPSGSRSSVFNFGDKGDFHVSMHFLLPNELVLREGDQFSIHHGPLRIPMLYRVTRDASSDHLGRTTVRIVPGLRMNVIPNDPITFYRPRTVFRIFQQPQSQRAINILPNEGNIFVQLTEVPKILGVNIGDIRFDTPRF